MSAAVAVEEVWVAPSVKTALGGDGSEAHPFDGSTPGKLASLINDQIPEGVLIHLLGGTFHVSELAPKAGMKLVGAGKNATVFFGVGGEGLVRSWGGANGAAVSDLTMNGQGMTAFAVQFFDSNDVVVRNIRVTNFRGLPAGESFVVHCFAQSMSPSGLMFERVEIDGYVGGPGGATLIGFGHGGGGDPQNMCTGVIQGCYLHDSPGVQAGFMGGRNCIIRGNLVERCLRGAYWDTWPMVGCQVIENFFLQCPGGGVTMNGHAGGHEDPNNATEGVVIADNVVELPDAETEAVVGISVAGQYVKNTLVARNQVIKNVVAGNWQRGYQLEPPTTVARDNYASPGLFNVWPVAPSPAAS